MRISDWSSDVCSSDLGNHPRLLALLAELLRTYKSVTYVCDKRFLLILMFCDYAVEPWYYERGCNFYEDGQNYGMASLLATAGRSEEHTSELQSLMRISYAVFCLKKKNNKKHMTTKKRKR